MHLLPRRVSTADESVRTVPVTIRPGRRSTDVDGPDPARELRFTQLWTAAHPTVAGFVRGLIPDRAAVDDILQEVALALFNNLAGYDPKRPFVAWALGIAKHKVQDRWRSLARSKQVIRDTQVLDAMAAVSAELDDELDGRRRALQECLGKVQGRAYNLLRLHYHNGHEPREIAGILGLEAGHVRVLLNRVRGALRQCIERRLVEQGTT